MDKVLLILLVFILGEKNKMKKQDLEGGQETSLGQETREYKLDIKASRQKLDLMKKIGPYFPQEYTGPINKSIGLTEQILVLHEALDFINENKTAYIESALPLEDNKERLNYIINIVRQEVESQNIQNMGLALDMIINVDKYKGMVDMFAKLISQPNALEDPKAILELMAPFLAGKTAEERKRIEEMAKILEVFTSLDKKEKAADENQLEG